MMTFLFNGTKLLTLEQASDLADYFGLSEAESEYFFHLVWLERSGHHRLKSKIEKQVQKLRAEGLKIRSRVKKDKELNDIQKSIYYSSWIYTGIRNLAAIDRFSSSSDIAKHLQIPVAAVNAVLSFLDENGLIRKTDKGFEFGPSYTHLSEDSPFADRLRQSWRIRGFQKMDQKVSSDLFFSSPMSLSVEDADRIKALLIDTVSKAVAIMKPSPSEVARCLNIDWFEF